MQRVNTIDGQSITGINSKRREVKCGEITGVVNSVEPERHAHESSELLHPRADLTHDPLGSGRSDGGDGEMWSVIGGAGGESFKQGWPLSAKSRTEIKNMETLGIKKGFKNSSISSDMAESGPRTEFLETEESAASGVER